MNTTSIPSVDHNKLVSRRWIELFNARDDAGQTEILGSEFLAHAPASLEPTALDTVAWDRFIAGFVQGFPDLQLTVKDAVAEGDLVAQRIHFAGTHTGSFRGLPATSRRVSFEGLELNLFVDGRVAEHWFQLDALSLLQQLGLVLVPGPRLLSRIVGDRIRQLLRFGRGRGRWR